MKRNLIAIAATVLSTVLATGEMELFPSFTPHPLILADAVREADVIFMSVTTRVDPTHYDDHKRETTYS